MKQTAPTLLLVPDELLRAGLLRTLVGTRYKVIEAKGGWDSVLASGRAAPSVVILFLRGDGSEADRSLKSVTTMAERSKVVVLTDRCEPESCRVAVCAGASAYLPRSIGAEALLHVLDLVQEGEIVFPGSLAAGMLGCGPAPSEDVVSAKIEHPLQPAGDGRLSSREVEILQRLVHGESNKQISRRLDISETTVKVHIKAVLRKLRVCNRTQAAIWGLEHLANGRGAASPPALVPPMPTEPMLPEPALTGTVSPPPARTAAMAQRGLGSAVAARTN